MKAVVSVLLVMSLCLEMAFATTPVVGLKSQRPFNKRISLNFQKIDIRPVLQLMAEFKSINMVVSDKVTGDITLSLNDIPWEEALDIILTTHGLTKRKEGSVWLIDTRESMDKMKEARLKSRKTIQKLEPMRSELLQIKYAKAQDLALLVKDKQIGIDTGESSSGSNISFDARTNTLLIQDTASKISQVRQLIQKLDVPVKQVQIEARIVEVSKEFSQDIGIKWGMSKPSAIIDGLEGSPPVNAYTPNHLNLDLMALPASLLAPSTLGLALATLGDGILLDLELSALESEGQAHLISNPRIITTNQQPASIESGEEIPYQEFSSHGNTSVSFKKAVLSLKVTPQITPDGKILMTLKINQDTRSPHTFNNVPTILTKQIQTNVLVNNGQTIVLGGIYKQDKRKNVNRIPFLGELPAIGVLFRNKQITLANQELLIFITPKIISDALTIQAFETREKIVGDK